MGKLKFKPGDFVETTRPWTFGFINKFHKDLGQYEIYALKKRNKTWTARTNLIFGKSARLTDMESIKDKLRRYTYDPAPYGLNKLMRYKSDAKLFCQITRTMPVKELQDIVFYMQTDVEPDPTYDVLKNLKFDYVYDYTPIRELKPI